MASIWHIQLFGGLTVTGNGQVINHFRTRKTAALLAYLAYEMPTTIPRERLMEALWPDIDIDSQRNRLSIALTTLRKLLDPNGADNVIIADRLTVRLNPHCVTTDVAQFDRMRVLNGTGEQSSNQLSAAIELYLGPLLPNGDEDWIAAERVRRADQFVITAQAHATILEKQGELEQAIGVLRRVTEFEPLREEVQRDLIRLLGSVGRSADAFLQFRQLERALRDELDIPPSPATRALIDQLREEPTVAVHNVGPVRVVATELAPERPLTLPPVSSANHRASVRRRSLALVLAAVLVTGITAAIWWSRRPEPGVPLWVFRYEVKPDELDSEPTAITTDHAGNIYVTGFVKTQKNDVDFLTMKISPECKVLWRARFNSPENDADRAYALALDKQGNVYVAGESYNGDREKGKTQWDMTLVKYDLNGREVWHRFYNGPPNDDDRPAGVGVDDSGYVYVSGTSRDPKDLSCLVALKYSPSGEQVWARHFNRPAVPGAPLFTSAWGMALDPSGSMYIVGEARVPTAPSEPPSGTIFTVCYDRRGNLVWNRLYEADIKGGARGRRIALKSDGAICVAGMATNVADKQKRPVDNLVVLRYDINGKEQGIVQRTDSRIADSVTGLVVNSEGQVAVGTQKINGQSLEIAFDSTGKLCWERIVDQSEAITHEARSNMVADSSGRFCYTTFGRGREGGSCVVTTKFRANSKDTWTRTYEGPKPGHHQGITLCVDGQDNVITAAQSYNGKNQDLILLKYGN